MLVQRVVSPASPLESWTVLGDDDAPVGPIERYLAYLTDIERSPNTIKAYAHDLKDWFAFLDGRGVDWREVRLEDIGEFVASTRPRRRSLPSWPRSRRPAGRTRTKRSQSCCSSSTGCCGAGPRTSSTDARTRPSATYGHTCGRRSSGGRNASIDAPHGSNCVDATASGPPMAILGCSTPPGYARSATTTGARASRRHGRASHETNTIPPGLVESPVPGQLARRVREAARRNPPAATRARRSEPTSLIRVRV
ncbi:phage integrase family protein with SAM-like domain [Amycolatopsis echigonensis]|uniref:Phage integrase family protein with SAM-like domain n=1 Tax=Amycolatopsis echigonensis TaxID=2576905 RepID=A0A2N3WFJ3_9PSEU|nr:phage integrase family protein with SAM-like domain [Amycolatopsis niigatensis]